MFSYGPKGAQVVGEALLALRPAINESVAPLGPSDFFFFVLIPNVIFLLMKENHKHLDEDGV